MYEDSWYSFVPELQPKKENVVTHNPGHRRRESLLKQPNDGGNAIENRPDMLQEIYEISPLSKGPPEATVIRRASSYTDFYHVARAHITKDVRKIRAENCAEWVNLAAAPAKSGVDFECLYEDHEDELLDASQEDYQLYLEQLMLSERHLDSLLVDTTSALDLLATLSESFKNVEAQTSAFQAQCEDLLDEQKRLKSLADEVGEDLQYYSYLEPITRRLNAPGSAHLVRGEGIVEILETLEDCIVFMTEHSQHRESENYLTRYNSLLQRSLNLVQITFAEAMDRLARETLEKISKADSETIKHAYAYGSWKDVPALYAAPIRTLTHHTIEAYGLDRNYGPGEKPRLHSLSRFLWDRHAETYRNIIDLIMKAREGFVLQETTRWLNTNLNAEEGQVSAMSHAVDHIMDTCRSENIMILQMFAYAPGIAENVDYGCLDVLFTHQTTYKDFISKIAGQLKPKLVTFLTHQTIDQAVELELWFLRKHMNPENEDIALSERLPGQFAIGVARQFLEILEPEVRLHFFTAINRDITNYNPKPEDYKFKSTPLDDEAAATPAAAKAPEAPMNATQEELGIAQAEVKEILGQGLNQAFPTVRTAIKLLVLHHEIIQTKEASDEDDDLSYAILHNTTESLQRAATYIKNNADIVSAQLFLIKNLLFLKNLLVNYEMSASHKSSHIELAHIWTTFVDLRSRGKLFDPRAYYNLLGSGQLFPKVVESDLDARLELDGILRQQITKFTELWAGKIQVDPTQKGALEKELVESFWYDKKVVEALEAAVQDLLVGTH